MIKIESMEFPYDRNLEELERKIRWLIRDDFEPYGNTMILPDHSICQPMVKYSKPEKNEISNINEIPKIDDDIKELFDLEVKNEGSN